MGTFNTILKIVRTIDRHDRQQQKSAIQQYQLLAKQEHLSDVSNAIAKYDDYIQLIQSIHKECSDKINWTLLSNFTLPHNRLQSTSEKK